MSKLFAPNGVAIAGTYDMVPGLAGITNEGVTRNADGTYEFEWAGATDMFWNDQTTVIEDNRRVFLDEDGNQWHEDQLVLRDDDDADV